MPTSARACPHTLEEGRCSCCSCGVSLRHLPNALIGKGLPHCPTWRGLFHRHMLLLPEGPAACGRGWASPTSRLLSLPILVYHKMFYSLCDSEGSFLLWEIAFRPAETGVPAGSPWRTGNVAGLQRELAKGKGITASTVVRSCRDGWDPSSRM